MGCEGKEGRVDAAMLSNNMRLNNLVCYVDVFTIGVKFVAQEDVLAFLWSTPMN